MTEKEEAEKHLEWFFENMRTYNNPERVKKRESIEKALRGVGRMFNLK
jgi:hypothetical protein|tara:strand:- start:527 stop:670 length:144 start_codon:yes stop_codon:yes gene_type:complete